MRVVGEIGEEVVVDSFEGGFEEVSAEEVEKDDDDRNGEEFIGVTMTRVEL